MLLRAAVEQHSRRDWWWWAVQGYACLALSSWKRTKSAFVACSFGPPACMTRLCSSDTLMPCMHARPEDTELHAHAELPC